MGRSCRRIQEGLHFREGEGGLGRLHLSGALDRPEVVELGDGSDLYRVLEAAPIGVLGQSLVPAAPSGLTHEEPVPPDSVEIPHLVLPQSREDVGLPPLPLVLDSGLRHLSGPHRPPDPSVEVPEPHSPIVPIRLQASGLRVESLIDRSLDLLGSISEEPVASRLGQASPARGRGSPVSIPTGDHQGLRRGHGGEVAARQSGVVVAEVAQGEGYPVLALPVDHLEVAALAAIGVLELPGGGDLLRHLSRPQGGKAIQPEDHLS